MKSAKSSPDGCTRCGSCILAISFLYALTPTLVCAARITYTVNPVTLSAGTQVSGTITTDGTLGPLATESIIDYQIKVDYRGADPFFSPYGTLPFFGYEPPNSGIQSSHIVATPCSLTLEPPTDEEAFFKVGASTPYNNYLSRAISHELNWSAPAPLPDASATIAAQVGIMNTNYDFFLRELFQDLGLVFDRPLEVARVSILQAGDADQDFDFDQLDLVRVQIAAKYLTGEAATWGDGDWNAAPGGSQGNPPAGDGLFNQLDIVAAQQAGIYLTGPYAAVQPNGEANDDEASIVYNVGTGELAVDAQAGMELTPLNIDSAAGILSGDAAENLGGSFDNDADNNIFKATFGSSFGSLSFGNVAQPGLSEQFVLNDLAAVGSLAGRGDLGDVDLIYVPEPSTFIMLAFGMVVIITVVWWQQAKCVA